MLVKEIMNTDVQTVKKGATIQEAARMMSESRIGCLIVTDKDRVRGIITERDIMRNIVSKGKDPRETKVEEAMSEEVVMVEPDLSVEDAAELMMEKGVKKLPVISNDQLVGIVTVTDICMASPRMIEKVGKMLLVPKKGHKPVAG